MEVGTAGHVWLSHISHIYKDACGLAQAKGLPSLIYHEPAIEVKFMRGAAGTTRILTIRCRDGLHVDRVNRNQGAESTLAFILSLAEMRLAQNMRTSFKEPIAVAEE